MIKFKKFKNLTNLNEFFNNNFTTYIYLFFCIKSKTHYTI